MPVLCFHGKRGAPLCIISWLKSWLKSANHVALCRKSWLKSAWNTHGYLHVTGSTMPIFGIEIVFEIVIEIGKPCSTMQKIVIEIVTETVIEIGMEHTRLFQCNGSTMPIFVTEIVIEFFRTSSALSEKFWLKSAKNQSQNEHGYFLCNRFHCAENHQSGPSRFFFREVGGAYEYLCYTRAVHDAITSTSSLLRRS